MKNDEWRNNVRRPKGKPMKNEEWRFVWFVWFVFKKYIRVFFQNPSQIPFVLSRYNQKENQTKIQKKKSKKRIRVKTPKKIGDTPWAFFDLSSVAAGLQSAMQQYYLPTIYVIRRRTGRSLAIVRSVSLRLQDEGQKKLTEYHRCTRSLWHGFFLTFVFMHRDSKRICERYRLRLLRRMKKQRSAAEGKANVELSALPIKNPTI